ncbi:MAG: helix-turn-helix domain-containing protein [Lachnospiraceae bacterium]|nr:helix-turn-helix domain-containing protein [Lachnospiraceae bacterium]
MDREQQYDITEGDLNPTFLFSCLMKRTEDEAYYHAHDFIELLVILKGEGVIHIEGRNCLVQEGDLVLINPGTYHRALFCQDAAIQATEFYLAFSNVAFRDCERGKMPLFRGGKIITSMPDGWKQEMFRLCTAISKEAQTNRMGRYFMLKAYLIQVLCLIEREQSEEEKSGQPGYIFKSVNKKYVVRQITKYLEKHYQEKISLDQIAANMYLSPFYISKIFKSETGDTPINYLINLRMEKAKEILDGEPTKSIQSIAAAVGYEDAYHFSKIFKKYSGMSPLHYRGRE